MVGQSRAGLSAAEAAAAEANAERDAGLGGVPPADRSTDVVARGAALENQE